MSTYLPQQPTPYQAAQHEDEVDKHVTNNSAPNPSQGLEDLISSRQVLYPGLR